MHAPLLPPPRSSTPRALRWAALALGCLLLGVGIGWLAARRQAPARAVLPVLFTAPAYQGLR
ncbi:MAG: hypothetical protein KGJ64_12000, partial [Betaproteobacteria bacterium]|nr:hypothetical protein [Betaproteobacteria bacterium]